MQRIGRTKIEAFFEEFPFLSRYFDKYWVHEVCVKRIDENLLHRQERWHERGYFDYFGVQILWKALLLDREGNLLARAGYRPRYRNPRRRWWQLWRRKWLKELPGGTPVMIRGGWGPCSVESIEDCLASLTPEQRNRIFFVVLHGRSRWQSITLYKLPKGARDIDTWIASRLATERATLQQQCAAIDVEIALAQ